MCLFLSLQRNFPLQSLWLERRWLIGSSKKRQTCKNQREHYLKKTTSLKLLRRVDINNHKLKIGQNILTILDIFIYIYILNG